MTATESNQALAQLIAKIESTEAKIGIVGLGYVGLPLALGYTGKGYQVVGLDVDRSKVDSINAGKSYIEHIPTEEVKTQVTANRLSATDDFQKAKDLDALILCVPTPLDEHYEPDLSYVISTIEALVPHLREGQIVSLESTTYPGTTEEELRPRIEAQGLEVGEDLFLVYSPEREDPGNEQFAGINIPKVVGGTTQQCATAGQSLYGAVFGAVVPVRSTQVAEFSKLLENIYRAVNIGLVNELKIAADRMGIDIWEVIEAASTKPFGFKAFYPGPGLGGHCIPIDPFYLTWKAREFGVHTRFIELAGEINRSMPEYVVSRTIEALNNRAKAVNGSRLLILGLAYKSDVDDMRESPTFELMDRFSALGGRVEYYDPHIPVITPTREHAKWTGRKSVSWNESSISEFDAVIIATHHRKFNLSQLVEWADLIVDTRNALKEVSTREGQLFKA